MKLRKVLAGAMALVMAVGAIVVAPVNADAAEQKVADIKSGLISYYTFDDTLANSAKEDSAATMKTGEATYADNGVVGKAFNFAANAGTLKLENAAVAVQLETLPTTTTFTLNLWVYNETEGAVGTYAFFDGCCQYFQFRNNGAGAFAASRASMASDFSWETACGDHWRTGKDTSKAATWQMVTYTVSETGKATVYVDGVEVASYWDEPGYTEDGWFAYQSGDKYINMFSDDASRWTDVGFLGTGDWWSENFAGLMDNVTMYERALTADDVAALYAAKGDPNATVVTTAITLSETTKTLVTGTDFTLEVTAFEPVAVTEAATVTWSSSDDTIATVENGKVTAVKAGTATITASVSDTVKATCEVTITDEVKPLTAIDVTADKTEIELNATANLTVTYNPEDTTDDKAVTWSTSDDKVATVKDGVVTAVGYGKATITAKVGELTDTVEITVLERPATALDVKADKTELKVGETATITTTVTPADTTDAITYESSNGKVVTVDNGKVTAVGAGNATVTVKAGDITKEVKFTVTETSEIKLGDLTVDGFWSAHTAGVEIVAGKTYTITLDAKSTDSTNAWNCPVYVVYTNSAAKVDNASADYKEYLVCRADNWAWTGAGDSGAGTLGDGYKFETIAVPDSTDWVATYKEAMAAGAEGKITAVLSGKNLVVTFNIAGVESKATIPVDTSKPLYISLTGEKVQMEDITAVVKTIPAKGDFSPVLPIALVVLGGAVVVVASKKRFA